MSKKAGKQIEIEMRAMFDKNKHDEIKVFLDEKAEDLGEDDKDVWFFLLPDKFAKVTKNESKGTAKMTLKLNRPGRGSSGFEEIEYPISPDDFDKAVKLFSNLPFDERQNSYQKRHNYLYKGVELALKFTETWGYHLEFEVLISDSTRQKEAEKKICKVADELGTHILSEQELDEITKRIDEEYRQGRYKK
ncbi:CYTH domain-containing protein [Candidatus Microgenomates bacterium]|jgi:adenylate cyclase class IV|nr:MAG: CYTH domain-containing protein [Candidatus Microgenomates bacterium]